MTVLTSELTWCTDGFGIRNLSTAPVQCRVVQHDDTIGTTNLLTLRWVVRLDDHIALIFFPVREHGIVDTSFLGKWSFKCSKIYDPMPLPVPPAWVVSTKPPMNRFSAAIQHVRQ